jgi:hypothetical protein
MNPSFSAAAVGIAARRGAKTGSHRSGEIVEGKVCAQFDIDPRTAYTDAEVFVEELASHGILVLSDQPISVWPMPVKEGSWAH